jgi:uncharacterized lipoprotein YmbA
VYRVEVVVNRFDGQLGGDVVLDAKWSIVTEMTNKLDITRTSYIRENTSGSDFEALVNASSLAIARMSEEIAMQLEQLCAAMPDR